MKIASIYCAMLLLILAGCSDPITIGGDILGPDQANLQIVDTFTIRTATVAEEDLVIFSPTVQFGTNLCGHFDDPVFGDVKADFFSQFEVNITALPDFEPDSVVVFDSLVLHLDYDFDGFYGDSSAIHDLEIFRITGPNITFDDGMTFISGDPVFETEAEPIATIQFAPNFQEQMVLSIDDTVSPPDSSFETVSPFLSILLAENDGTPNLISNGVDGLVDIHLDTLDQNNDDFLAAFGGLAIKPVNGPTGSMLNFNTLSGNSGLFLYFQVGSGTNPESRTYQYNTKTSSIRFSSFTNNQAPDIVSAIADGFEAGETETYIQGMDGPKTLLQLPFITDFKNDVLVNNAELTLTIQSNGDTNLFPPVEQIIVSYQNDEGDFIPIEDFDFATEVLNLGIFGGQPEVFTTADGQLSRYRMNIAGHLQRMIDGEFPNEIFLQVFMKNERANRVILFGSDHPEFPVTLTANFTKLN